MAGISEKPWARKTLAVVIFLAAALVQIFFKNIPWPVSVESNDKLRSAVALLGAQEIVLSDAVVSPNHELLTYDGNAFELVDFDFDRAQLGEATASYLGNFPPAPPSEPGKWSFVTHD